PVTCTASSSATTVTPLGIVTGRLPILDMSFPLPEPAQQLAAESGFASFAFGHESARGRQDRGAETAHHARDLVSTHVHPASGTAHALNAGDHARVLARILEIDAQHALLAVLDDLVVVDETLAQQHLG